MIFHSSIFVFVPQSVLHYLEHRRRHSETAWILLWKNGRMATYQAFTKISLAHSNSTVLNSELFQAVRSNWAPSHWMPCHVPNLSIGQNFISYFGGSHAEWQAQMRNAFKYLTLQHSYNVDVRFHDIVVEIDLFRIGLPEVCWGQKIRCRKSGSSTKHWEGKLTTCLIVTFFNLNHIAR